MLMDGIHSYEQRSSSEIGHELDSNQNRVIIVNRRDPNVSWSTTNQPIESSGIGLLKALKKHLVFCRLRQGPSNKVDNSSSFSSSISTTNYDSGPFPSNEWLTSKYTLFNFLPKNLFEQFRRLANFYFLTTAILQIIIPYSPVGATTSLLPLIFVVATTAIKQAYEDYLRHKLDKEVNDRLCLVLRNKKLIKVRTRNICVGDFVYVKNNEEIPCDMILLAVSCHPSDLCYVTTSNLDGETSLKSRTCFQIRQHLGSIEKLDDTMLVIECDRPNATLYEFNGYLRAPKNDRSYELLLESLKTTTTTNNSNTTNQRFRGSQLANNMRQQDPGIAQTILKLFKQNDTTANHLLSTGKFFSHNYHKEILLNKVSSKYHEISLDVSNLLLRASRLRNTTYIYGLAVYTGRDTKLAQNSHVKPNKFSSTESKVNLYLVIAFLLLLIFSIIAALRYQRHDNWFFKGVEKTDSIEQIFIAHFLLYNYLVPISLYVTLEFIKFFGTISVVDDNKMKATVWRSVIDTPSKDITKTAAATADNNIEMQQVNQLAMGGSESLTSMSSMKKVKVIEGPKCNSSDLNEELGQVEVLFSDKTGTLTENKMRFMACSIYGQLYRSIKDQLYLQPADLYKATIPNVAMKLAQVSSNRYAFLAPQVSQVLSRVGDSSSGSYKEKLPELRDNIDLHSTQRPFDHKIVPTLNKLKIIDDMEHEERVVEFFICLCLCSTITLNESLPLAECLPDKTLNDYDFQTASPDEESLISAAHLYGITMCKSNDHECYIVIPRKSGKSEKRCKNNNQDSRFKGNFRAIVDGKNSNDKFIVRHFERLMVFEFNSVRKRMSVIYKDCDNDCLLMVTKGSEELLDCIKLTPLHLRAEHCVNVTLAHFEAFAKSGLRTLLVAKKIVEVQEYEQFAADMKDARLSIQNRDHLLNMLYNRAEIGLRLIGTTAVEDILQDGVPETIANLKDAGIKVWLLTGDKVETAISVAYLCKLLERDMILFQLVRQQDVQACQKLLISFEQQLKSIRNNENYERKKSDRLRLYHFGSTSNDTNMISSRRRDYKFALIADGRSLYYAMKYAKNELSQLCKQCTCVLGCRLSPIQKAEVVDLIKQSEGKPITAAIGDGANDVSMIQEAHVGIGVSGKEGKQAVNCSDFAINRFHMLNRLLFVHGHLFYNRSANTIHYFFYKNILFILPQFLYSFYNLSSAQSLYHPILLISYNLFFTSLPILLYGLFETYIPETLLESYPKLYRDNRGNRKMRMSVFITWLAIGALQASIGFYMLYFNWGSHTPFLESGKMAGINGFAIILYFVIVLTATFKLYSMSKSHTLYFNLSSIASCVMLPILLYIYSLWDWSFMISDNSLYGQIQICLTSPMFWVATFTTTAATILPDIIWYVQGRIVYFRRLNEVIYQHHAFLENN